MRTAIISDIHGNFDGLLETLEDIKEQKCDRIFCLGDLVEGGHGNEKVVCEIINRKIYCVRGNHDQINNLNLSKKIDAFLKQLPEQIIEKDICYTHISPRISPRNKLRGIDNAREAWNVFGEINYRITFIGHVHIPLIFGEQCEELGTSMKYAFSYNEPFHLNDNDRYIISVGSIGYGKDMVGKIRYGIYDLENRTIEIRAINGPLLEFDWKITFG